MQNLYAEQKLKQIANKVLKMSTADQTEVILSVTDHALTRFANSQIHQNVTWIDLGVSVRVVLGPTSPAAGHALAARGKRVGVASANSFDKETLRNVVARAEEVAKHQKDDPSFVSLPGPKPFKKKGINIDADVVASTPEERALAVSTIIKKVKKHKGVVASGAYDSSITEIAVANSLGVWAYHKAAAQDLSTILLGPTSTGFGAQLAKKPSLIN